MLQIYSLSKETSVWLGIQAQGSEDAMRNLQAAALLREKAPRSAEDQAEKETLLKQANSLVLCVHPSIIDLLSRRWWSRVWVIQEVAVSKSVELYCGPSTITWEHLQSALEHLRAHEALLPVFLNVKPHRVQKTLDRADSLDEARNAFHNRDGTSILKLLSNHRSAKATDSRDKDVALAGLNYPQCDLGILSRPYLQSVLSVYVFTVTNNGFQDESSTTTQLPCLGGQAS